MKDSRYYKNAVKHSAKQAGGFLSFYILGYAVTFLFNIFYARMLGPGPVGMLALMMSIVYILSAISVFGLRSGLVKFIPRYQARGEEERSAAIIRFSVALCSLISLTFAAVIIIYGKEIAAAFKEPALAEFFPMFSITVLFLSLSQIFYGVYEGHKNVSAVPLFDKFLFSFLQGAIFLVLYFLAAKSGRSLFQATFLAITGVFLVSFTYVHRKYFDLRRCLSGVFFDPEFARYSTKLFLTTLMAVFILKIDKIMLGYFLSSRDVGSYAMAFQMGNVVLFFHTAILFAMRPVFSEMHSTDNHFYLEEIYRFSVKWAVLLTLPLVICFCLYARILMGLFGKAFVYAWPVLVISSLGYLGRNIVGPSGEILAQTDKENLLVINRAAMVVLNIALNLILIPRYGIIGAAVATASAYAFDSLLSYIELRYLLKVKVFPRHSIFQISSFSLVAFMVSLVLFKFMPQKIWAVGLNLILCYLFLGIAMLFFFRGAEEELLVRSIIKKFTNMVGENGT